MSPPKWNTQPSPERSSRLPAIWDRDLPPKRDSPPSSEAVTRFDDRAGPEWHRTGLAPRPGPRARECGCSGPCRSLGPTAAQRVAASIWPATRSAAGAGWAMARSHAPVRALANVSCFAPDKACSVRRTGRRGLPPRERYNRDRHRAATLRRPAQAAYARSDCRELGRAVQHEPDKLGLAIGLGL